MAVSLKPEVVFEIGSYPVTNSLLTGFIIVGLLILFFAIYTRKLSVKPRSRLQLLIESLVTGLHDLAVGVMGEKLTKIFFPFVFTFFILIISSNWFGLLPVVGSVGYAKVPEDHKQGLPILVFGQSEEEIKKEKVKEEEDILEKENATEASSIKLTRSEEIEPLFRSPSADLNFTVALAIVSFILIEYAGIKILGLGHLAKFFDYRVKIQKGWKIILTPLMFFVNFFNKTLELILELSKLISFSFRLFGNIFAGEVLLLIVTSLSYGILTFPFLGLEIFVGLIQATVFMFLVMVFIKVGTDHHH